MTQAAWLKKLLPAALAEAARTHPRKRIALIFHDEARLGQKGRLCHRWWRRGLRPPGLVDQRHNFADMFAAVEPATGEALCLVLPEVSTKAMNRFLADFSATLPAATHALMVMVLDGAGWHTSGALKVPDNLSLLRLPPSAPELNPVERVWLFLRERYLSHRRHTHYAAILDAAGDAWRQLTADRLRPLCAYSWIERVRS